MLFKRNLRNKRSLLAEKLSVATYFNGNSLKVVATRLVHDPVDEPVSFQDPEIIRRIDERLDLLSIPPSLTTDNLERTLKEFARWPSRLSPQDQILYAQHVIPTLLRYFHATYTVETMQLRVDAGFFTRAAHQPSFHTICAILQCIPLAHRPTIVENTKGYWLYYNIRILQTLHALLLPTMPLSLDTTLRDAIATNLSDALVKMVLVNKHFPSMTHADGDIIGWEQSTHVLGREDILQSLGADARAKVKANLQLVEGIHFYNGHLVGKSILQLTASRQSTQSSPSYGPDTNT